MKGALRAPPFRSPRAAALQAGRRPGAGLNSLRLTNRHGKTRRLPLGVAAVRAARAADRDHDRFLLLAGGPGGLLLVPAAGRLRPEDRVRRPAQFRRAVPRPALPGVVQDHGGVQRLGGAGRHRHLAAARDHGRPRAARRAGLQDAADLALCGGPGGGGRAVGASCSRRRSASSPTVCSQLGVDWNWVLQRRPGHAAGGDRLGVEADQLQLPVLPCRAAVDPEVADRGGGDRRRRSGAPLLDRSSSRCSRRPPSSCWW